MPPISGRIRARDLRAYVKDMGFENGMMHTVELMLAEHVEFRQHLRELTELTAKCIDQVNTMVQAGDGMKRALEQIKRERQQGDAHGDQR